LETCADKIGLILYSILVPAKYFGQELASDVETDRTAYRYLEALQRVLRAVATMWLPFARNERRGEVTAEA
jgi:hypothetical protein